MSKQAAQDIFDSAGKAFSEKQYAEARDLLLSLKKEGITSSDIEANLGKVFFELQDYSSSVLHFENAIGLNRFDFGSRRDQKLAQSKVPAGYGERVSHPSEWAHTIAGFVRPLELSSLASICLLIALFAKVFSKPKKIIFSFLLIALLLLSSAAFVSSGRSLAIVIAKESELRSAPLESSVSTMKLNAGSRVRIIRESGEYAEIERPGQFRGWISVKDLSRLPY